MKSAKSSKNIKRFSEKIKYPCSELEATNPSSRLEQMVLDCQPILLQAFELRFCCYHYQKYLTLEKNPSSLL